MKTIQYIVRFAFRSSKLFLIFLSKLSHKRVVENMSEQIELIVMTDECNEIDKLKLNILDSISNKEIKVKKEVGNQRNVH